MLRQRLTYGPLMIAALVLIFAADSRLDQVSLDNTPLQGLFLGRPYLPAGLVMLAAFLAVIPLGAIELCRIFEAKGIHADHFMVALAGMTGCVTLYSLPISWAEQSALILSTLVVLLFVVTLVKYSWGGRTQGAVAAAGVTMFALIYMGLAPGFYLAIRRWHSAWIIAGIILITKACDIGAFATGSLIGRHKLIPWLSPKKTWEGLVGGVCCSVLVAIGLGLLAQHLQSRYGYQLLGTYSFETHGPLGRQRFFQPHHYPIWALAVAGALLALVGHFGDLVASLFKRDAGIKDSGKSIPGFGGVLDVADSPVMVAPLAYWLLTLGRWWQV